MKELFIAMTLFFAFFLHASDYQILQIIVAEREYVFVGHHPSELVADCENALQDESLNLPLHILAKDNSWLTLSEVEIKNVSQLCLIIEQIYNKSPR